jgi:hypothetical protein
MSVNRLWVSGLMAGQPDWEAGVTASTGLFYARNEFAEKSNHQEHQEHQAHQAHQELTEKKPQITQISQMNSLFLNLRNL